MILKLIVSVRLFLDNLDDFRFCEFMTAGSRTIGSIIVRLVEYIFRNMDRPPCPSPYDGRNYIIGETKLISDVLVCES